MLKIILFTTFVSAGTTFAADASAVLRGQVRAQVPIYGYDYGDFTVEVSAEGLDQAVKGGFEGKVVDLPGQGPDEDDCEYELRSQVPFTLNIRIYGTKTGSSGLLKVIDRKYVANLYTSRSGMKPCLPFAPEYVGAEIRDVVSVNDLASGDEYQAFKKVLSKEAGPYGSKSGWDTYSVLTFAPVLRVPMGGSEASMGAAEIALDLAVSEYAKVNGQAVMSESGSYYHGFSTRVPLK